MRQTAPGPAVYGAGMSLLYRPFGLLLGIAAGKLGHRLFLAIWDRLDGDPPPTAITQEAGTGKVVGASVLEAAIMTGTTALVLRGGARAWERFFGVWPGSEPDPAAEAA